MRVFAAYSSLGTWLPYTSCQADLVGYMKVLWLFLPWVCVWLGVFQNLGTLRKKRGIVGAGRSRGPEKSMRR